MISKRTVFILGAGAHCSYGFPSGETLKNEIVQKTANPEHLQAENFSLLNFYGLASPLECQDSIVRSFSNALKDSGQPSIDAFLNNNRHIPGFEKIGKAAIAQILIRYELSNPSVDDNWLKYLFEKMISNTNNTADFTKSNRVSFITFNYDRYLESWLFKRIQNSYGVDEGNAMACLQSIPIKHVYGSIGEFVPNASLNPHQWAPASKEIRTIYDAEQDKNLINDCMKLLDEAETICILGFGFHNENITLLNLSKFFKVPQRYTYASRMGITDIELHRIKRDYLPDCHVEFSSPLDGCLSALRNLHVF
jgi:hypothetical protein